MDRLACLTRAAALVEAPHLLGGGDHMSEPRMNLHTDQGQGRPVWLWLFGCFVLTISKCASTEEVSLSFPEPYTSWAMQRHTFPDQKGKSNPAKTAPPSRLYP